MREEKEIWRKRRGKIKDSGRAVARGRPRISTNKRLCGSCSGLSFSHRKRGRQFPFQWFGKVEAA